MYNSLWLHGLYPPGTSVHGILHPIILEWVAMSSFRGSSPPRAWTQVSSIAGTFFTDWATKDGTWISDHLHWQVGSLLLEPPRKLTESLICASLCLGFCLCYFFSLTIILWGGLYYSLLTSWGNWNFQRLSCKLGSSQKKHTNCF